MLYLLLGSEAPELHALDRARESAMLERLSVADSPKARTDAFRLTFGTGGVVAVIPYSPATFESLFTAPDEALGAFADLARGIIAGVLLNALALPEDTTSATRLLVNLSGNGDGRGAELIPPRPVRPSPQNAASLVFGGMHS